MPKRNIAIPFSLALLTASLAGCNTRTSLMLQERFDGIHVGRTTATEVLNLLPEKGMLHTAESVSLLVVNGWTRELGIVRFSPTESVVLRTGYIHHRSQIAIPPWTRENLALVIRTTLPGDLLNEPYENEMRKFLAILRFYQSALIEDARPFEQDQQTLALIGLARTALNVAIWNLSNHPRRAGRITSPKGFPFDHPTLGRCRLALEEQHTAGFYTLTLTAADTVDPFSTW